MKQEELTAFMTMHMAHLATVQRQYEEYEVRLLALQQLAQQRAEDDAAHLAWRVRMGQRQEAHRLFLTTFDEDIYEHDDLDTEDDRGGRSNPYYIRYADNEKIEKLESVD